MTTAVSDVGPYAIVPKWVADALIGNPAALALYHRLALMADRETGQAWPSRSYLAKMLGCSSDTIDRLKRQLQAVGAITVESRKGPDGAPTSNVYTVHFAQGVAAPVRLGSRMDAAGGSRTGAALTRTTLEPSLSEGSQANSSRGGVALTSRSDAEAVGCPKCMAPAGTPCQGTRGLRESCHAERHSVVIMAGAPVLKGDTPARITSLPTALVDGERPDDFAAWYAAYPRKSARADAIKAWRTVLAELPEDVQTLIAATEALARRTQAEHPIAQEWTRYMPYPATWLRGLRWQDEMVAERVERVVGPCLVCGVRDPRESCLGVGKGLLAEEGDCPWRT